MKKLIALLLAVSLVGCGPKKSAPEYEAIFKGNDLGCCIVRDTLHSSPQAMQEGQSKLGETAAWNTNHKALEMVLGAPLTTPPDAAGNPGTPSMGVFLTGLNFGPGTAFSLSATFQRLSDTTGAKGWAVGVGARTGGTDDTPDLKRLGLTFRVKDSKAELRVLEFWGPMDTEIRKHAAFAVPQDVYDKIVGKTGSPRPFTLKLSIDRTAGSGTASMRTEGKTYPVGDFNMVHFTKAGGEPFTAVGAALANAADPGQARSVEVTDFKLWAH
jgi:hypothetical protein